MKDIWRRLWSRNSQTGAESEAEFGRQIAVLSGVYSGLIGTERFLLAGSHYNALSYLHAEDPKKRLAGLARIVLEDPDIPVPGEEQSQALLERTENRISDLLARQAVEERLEQKINDALEEKHQEYVNDLRLELLNEETGDFETPQSREKLAQLDKLDHIRLTDTIAAQVRPQTLADIVGQKDAVEALLAKLATKYPQHLLLYGPPGVGKTTAARVVLEAAKQFDFTPFQKDAPFVETDGTTLRWDNRDMTNPLIGSVHDPIYQGAQRDLADKGIPEPKPGLVTKAHGGVLFIDEIGEMDPLLLNKLLKVLEDKRVYFESSYYDEDDPQVAAYIKKLFRDGAPADFILIGATTRAPEEINPAIRSRCAEVFFAPLATDDVARIVTDAAQKLGVVLEDGVAAAIAEYTGEGRKAVQLLADAYGLAMYHAGRADGLTVTLQDLRRVAQAAHLVPQRHDQASAQPRVGHIFGLGVAGYVGSVIEVEAVAFPARIPGKGELRFNDTAGSMAKDSVFNASAAVRRVAGADTREYDLHVNVIGGGQIDGPSAGVAVTCALLSAITGIPLRQDIAVTGEVALNGAIKPIGGVHAKAYGAKQAGMKKMLIPDENRDDIGTEYAGLPIVRVKTIEDAWREMTAGGKA